VKKQDKVTMGLYATQAAKILTNSQREKLPEKLKEIVMKKYDKIQEKIKMLVMLYST